jgi:hypothetical protein
MFGGSANGDLFSIGPETGELTEVASANRAVRGSLCEDEEEELEPVLEDLAVIDGAFFSDGSAKPAACVVLFLLTISTGETGSKV